MGSDENQPTTIGAALSIIDALKRERDEAREKFESAYAVAKDQLKDIERLKALCLEAADELELEHKSCLLEYGKFIEEPHGDCGTCKLIKRLRAARGE